MLIYTLVRFCTIMAIFSVSFCVHASGLALAMKIAEKERAEAERLGLARRAIVTAVVVQNPLAVPGDSEERFGDLPRVDSMEIVSYAQGAQHPVNRLPFDGSDCLEVVSVDSSDCDLERVGPSSMQARRERTPLRRTVECQTDQQQILDTSCCSCNCCCFTLVARWFSGKQS